MNSSEFRKVLKKDILLTKKLHSRYLKYVDIYKPIYLKHLRNELTALHKHFPNVGFIMHARIKSFNGYTEKFEKKLKEGKTGNVYDLYAKKYIIQSVNGSTDEGTLTNMCYEFEKFLLDFNSKKFINLSDKRKDYIQNPKENGYKAVHITNKFKAHDDLFEETQIKTFRMHLCADIGEASHRAYKSRENFDLKKVPTYFTSTSLKDKSGNFIVYELSQKECIDHYYSEKKDAEITTSTYNKEH